MRNQLSQWQHTFSVLLLLSLSMLPSSHHFYLLSGSCFPLFFLIKKNGRWRDMEGSDKVDGTFLLTWDNELILIDSIEVWLYPIDPLLVKIMADKFFSWSDPSDWLFILSRWPTSMRRDDVRNKEMVLTFSFFFLIFIFPFCSQFLPQLSKYSIKRSISSIEIRMDFIFNKSLNSTV